jgi:hypothetical protein
MSHAENLKREKQERKDKAVEKKDAVIEKKEKHKFPSLRRQ